MLWQQPRSQIANSKILFCILFPYTATDVIRGATTAQKIFKMAETKLTTDLVLSESYLLLYIMS